jgi:hypothetical protein
MNPSMRMAPQRDATREGEGGSIFGADGAGIEFSWLVRTEYEPIRPNRVLDHPRP